LIIILIDARIEVVRNFTLSKPHLEHVLNTVTKKFHMAYAINIYDFH